MITTAIALYSFTIVFNNAIPGILSLSPLSCPDGQYCPLNGAPTSTNDDCQETDLQWWPVFYTFFVFIFTCAVLCTFTCLPLKKPESKSDTDKPADRGDKPGILPPSDQKSK